MVSVGRAAMNCGRKPIKQNCTDDMDVPEGKPNVAGWLGAGSPGLLFINPGPTGRIETLPSKPGTLKEPRDCSKALMLSKERLAFLHPGSPTLCSWNVQPDTCFYGPVNVGL